MLGVEKVAWIMKAVRTCSQGWRHAPGLCCGSDPCLGCRLSGAKARGCEPSPCSHFLVFFSIIPTESCLLVPASPTPSIPSPLSLLLGAPKWTSPVQVWVEMLQLHVVSLHGWFRLYYLLLSCNLSPGFCSLCHPRGCGLTEAEAVTLL